MSSPASTPEVVNHLGDQSSGRKIGVMQPFYGGKLHNVTSYNPPGFPQFSKESHGFGPTHTVGLRGPCRGHDGGIQPVDIKCNVNVLRKFLDRKIIPRLEELRV